MSSRPAGAGLHGQTLNLLDNLAYKTISSGRISVSVHETHYISTTYIPVTVFVPATETQKKELQRYAVKQIHPRVILRDCQNLQSLAVRFVVQIPVVVHYVAVLAAEMHVEVSQVPLKLVLSLLKIRP